MMSRTPALPLTLRFRQRILAYPLHSGCFLAVELSLVGDVRLPSEHLLHLYLITSLSSLHTIVVRSRQYPRSKYSRYHQADPSSR
ncbi:hypothetical protein GALMADRAFT_1068865 [Galerina marginata CBS 339.88]|uniref:Uncharacterized protein n=1 Tax=Galerina marginata (strain CBS 339.88) TaxID=685588 RepID=A0A067SIR8_GALM3|nr:hypothetical protein GALMADRAFT_1068865 [Galerina marginata CBS 339.88]